MCLMTVKEEEDYSVPARYKRVTRVREYSTSPPRSARVSRTAYIEERRPSGVDFPPPAPLALPPPESVAPSRTAKSHAAPSIAPTARSSTHIETTKSVSHAPSVAPSHAPTRAASHAPTHAPSHAPSTVRAPSVRSKGTRSHYVEVEDEEDTSPSSSSTEDVRSKATSHHTRKTSRSHRTSVAPSVKAPASEHRTSVPSVKPPASEYSIHEREHEIRRERGLSRPRGDEFETYRYVEAPRDRSRAGSGTFDPRASRESYRRERERIVIEDDLGRRRTDYRR